MSDRLAVFNHGRIEQVGTPANVYEKPDTRFVAGFVDTSNLLSGSVAQAIVGREGTFTVRPEKIRLAAPDGPVDGDETTVYLAQRLASDGPGSGGRT
jgi:putative spermidine/putrescine transport system ATP-binding protein